MLGGLPYEGSANHEKAVFPADEAGEIQNLYHLQMPRWLFTEWYTGFS